MDALHAVEEIQKKRLLSEVTKIGAFFAPNLGNWTEILGNPGKIVLSCVPHPCKMNVSSKHPIGTQRVQRMAYSQRIVAQKMEYDDLGDVEMNRLEKLSGRPLRNQWVRFFMSNGQPSGPSIWSGTDVSHQLNPLPTYSWILINVFFIYLL